MGFYTIHSYVFFPWNVTEVPNKIHTISIRLTTVETTCEGIWKFSGHYSFLSNLQFWPWRQARPFKTMITFKTDIMSWDKTDLFPVSKKKINNTWTEATLHCFFCTVANKKLNLIQISECSYSKSVISHFCRGVRLGCRFHAIKRHDMGSWNLILEFWHLV